MIIVDIMEEVEKWLKKAESDLLAAEINFQQGLFEVSAFLSQQSAEKALKSLYILKFKRLWRIHDLEKLSLTLKAENNIVKISGELNPHYIETRYVIEAEYTKEIAKTALENANKVVVWVKKKLKKE